MYIPSGSSLDELPIDNRGEWGASDVLTSVEATILYGSTRERGSCIVWSILSTAPFASIFDRAIWMSLGSEEGVGIETGDMVPVTRL